ncbi:MAG: DUF4926 domain-containing protein [Burkholderiaceae bacterium]|nr:DUF4926 domain-containing protein [Burkholderiaceae bacterium]
MQFAQYDVVMVKSFLTEKLAEADAFNRRPPRVGDVATIIEIYSNPIGYELECSDADGITEWMVAFEPHEVELELIK